jgi:hypothetical protein
MDASMAVSENSHRPRTWPWYRLYPGKAIVVAVGLFVAVSVLDWFNDGSGQAIAVLYILPIALLAVTLGERGGLTGAAAGFALFAVLEVQHSSGDIDATGWIVRAVEPQIRQRPASMPPLPNSDDGVKWKKQISGTQRP